MDPGVPLVIERRGDVAQAVHCGHAVLLDPEGTPVRMWGDPDTPIHFRSACKSLQAIPFVDVAARLGLDASCLAIACGSHEAEPDQVAAVTRILEAADLDASALQCAPHAVDERLAQRPPGGWTALYNNCSGKHAAMLAVCKDQDLPLGSYMAPDHPLQVQVHRLMEEATGQAVGHAVDGCGLPTWIASVTGLARAMQWQAQNHPAPIEAMRLHPRMVGGTGRFDTDVITATQGRVVAKIGAAGVHVALHHSGAALALKLTSGQGAPRDAWTAWILAAAGWSEAGGSHPALTNHAGRVVGRLEPAEGSLVLE